MIVVGSRYRFLIVVLLTTTYVAVVLTDAKSIFGGRVPGTKWCGPGTDAYNDTDFGEKEALDRCCYHHDRCEIRPLRKGLSRYGLNNTDKYTKSHCICDKKFHDCLHAIPTKWAGVVGRVYFRASRTCFMEYYPIMSCRNKKTYKK